MKRQRRKREKYMTQADYARYWHVSKPTVHQWAEQGRLVFAYGGPLLDVEASDERLEQTQFPTMTPLRRHRTRERPRSAIE
jgi:hypothetical protein